MVIELKTTSASGQESAYCLQISKQGGTGMFDIVCGASVQVNFETHPKFWYHVIIRNFKIKVRYSKVGLFLIYFWFLCLLVFGLFCFVFCFGGFFLLLFFGKKKKIKGWHVGGGGGGTWRVGTSLGVGEDGGR